MNEQNSNVISAWIKIFRSKKFLFLTVVFSISALLFIFDKFQNRTDMTCFTILGYEIDLAEWLPEEIIIIMEMVNKVAFVLATVPVIPRLLTAAGCWVIMANRKTDPRSVRRINLGLNLIKVNYFIQNATYKTKLAFYILLVTLIVPLFGVLQGGGDVVMTIYVVICLVGFAVLVVIASYYKGFLSLLNATTISLRSGENFVYKNKGVFFAHWVLAIWGILTSLGDGLLGSVTAICFASCYIIINRCFASFYKQCGSFNTLQWVLLPRKLKRDKEYRDVALLVGYKVRRRKPDGPLKKKAFMYWRIYTFGTKPLGYDAWKRCAKLQSEDKK